MQENIEKMLSRSDQLESLVDKTDDLQATARYCVVLCCVGLCLCKQQTCPLEAVDWNQWTCVCMCVRVVIFFFVVGNFGRSQDPLTEIPSASCDYPRSLLFPAQLLPRPLLLLVSWVRHLIYLQLKQSRQRFLLFRILLCSKADCRQFRAYSPQFWLWGSMLTKGQRDINLAPERYNDIPTSHPVFSFLWFATSFFFLHFFSTLLIFFFSGLYRYVVLESLSVYQPTRRMLLFFSVIWFHNFISSYCRRFWT